MAKSAASSFSSGIELGSFVTSSAVLCKSWEVIKSGYKDIIPYVGQGLSWKLYKEPDSGLAIVAFEVTQDSSTTFRGDLVSSNALREKNLHHFDFLCTKKAPDFFVNSTAISLFYENIQRLDELKSQIYSSSQLIVTGHGLGGPIASLFTLSLYDRNDEKKNSPEKKKDDKKKPLLCITFGSPLVGDKKFQEAISRSSTWSSSFLHVVSYEDPVSKRLNRETTGYMPFGTFLFCSDTNSTCFENPDSVLELLMNLINDQNHGSHPVDYGNIVDYLYRKAICKDFTPREKDLSNSNSLHASIYLQLEALGLTTDMPQQPQNTDINALVTTLEKLEHKLVLQKRPKIDPSKKLNIMKINMAQLESYKMNSKIRNIGYYDCYKNMNMPSDSDAVLYHKNLTKYWEEMVEQVDIKPQKEGAAFRTRWLYGGTNYRRMVEPLAIAQYYNEGGKDYMTDQSRSKHFVQLEEWLKEEAEKATSESNSADKSNVKPNSKSEKKKNVESILTFDSCFWAHVEEALLSCKLLEDVQSSVTQKEEATRELLKFEKYVYGLLMKYEVSSEIFLKQSSYMIWWYWYEAIKGTSYNSALKDFMSNSNNYNVQYVEGTYNFSPQAY